MPRRCKKSISSRPIACSAISIVLSPGKSRRRTQGTFHIGGESQELQEHMIVMAPSEVEHGVVNTSNTRLVLLVYMAPKP